MYLVLIFFCFGHCFKCSDFDIFLFLMQVRQWSFGSLLSREMYIDSGDFDIFLFLMHVRQCIVVVVWLVVVVCVSYVCCCLLSREMYKKCCLVSRDIILHTQFNLFIKHKHFSSHSSLHFLAHLLLSVNNLKFCKQEAKTISILFL